MFNTEPEAAVHLVTEQLAAAMSARSLLRPNGSLPLSTSIATMASLMLVCIAAETNLAPLLQELRHIEQVEDQDGKQFRFFKVSDDAATVLFEIVV